MKNLNDIFSGVDHVLNSAKHGNFEEVLTKTKNYAEQAKEKSAERIEISKKRIELLDSKTKLTKAYEKFGELQYAKCTGEEINDEEIQAAIQEIQLMKSRVEILESEIEEMRKDILDSIPKRDSRAGSKKDNGSRDGSDADFDADTENE